MKWLKALGNPLRVLSLRDYLLWGCSVLIITASFLLFPGAGVLPLVDALIGVTALIYLAKGHIYGQIITILFSVFYGIISLHFRYYGEMLTYLGMTMPMAMLATYTWLKNLYHGGTVKVRQTLSRKWVILLLLLTLLATALFGWILWLLNTPQLTVSIISIATSFLAASLTALRSPFYALAYAVNDVVLIVLWSLAAKSDPACIPTVACFAMFLCNDLYGFLSWRKLAVKQAEKSPEII